MVLQDTQEKAPAGFDLGARLLAAGVSGVGPPRRTGHHRVRPECQHAILHPTGLLPARPPEQAGPRLPLCLPPGRRVSGVPGELPGTV